jgi:hypothetical protein
VADLAVNLLALPTRGREAVLLAHHICHTDRLVPALFPRLVPARLARLVPALLLGHSTADLSRLVPALLPWLVPALAEGVANPLGDGGALLLHQRGAHLLGGGAALPRHGGHAHLLQRGAALPPRLCSRHRDLDRLAVCGGLVPALLLPDSLADRLGDDEDAGKGLAQHEWKEDEELHFVVLFCFSCSTAK